MPSLAALEVNGNNSLRFGCWEPLSQLSVLTRLGLEWCRLPTPPQQLSALHALRELAIGYNGISMCDHGAFVEALCPLLRPLTRLARLTGHDLGVDLGERLAAAGVHVPCVVTVSSADWV